MNFQFDTDMLSRVGDSVMRQSGALMLSLEICLLILVVAGSVLYRRVRQKCGSPESSTGERGENDRRTCRCGRKQSHCPWCKEAAR
jgi:hypothetical protein